MRPIIRCLKNYGTLLITLIMDKQFGLMQEDIETIINILKDEVGVEKAIIFGSRAKGNYRNGSDVDIALKGEKVNFGTISNILYLLNEETMMPYRFDEIGRAHV